MDIEVLENPARHRFEILVDGQVAGYSEYRSQDGHLALVHTVIANHQRGKGLAGTLIRQTLDTLRARGSQVLPYCPFVRDFIISHPDYEDLVPEDRRAMLAPAHD